MKNLLALAAFVLLTVGAVGWFRGWFDVNSTPTDNGQNRVIIDINSQKIKQDLDTGRDKLKKILDTDNKNSDDPGTPQSQSGTPAQPPFPSTSRPDLPTVPPLPQNGGGTFVLPAAQPGVPPPPMPTATVPDYGNWTLPYWD
jgi:hypothetical protein